MHKLLQRQLRKLGLTPDSLPDDPADWEKLIHHVNDSYTAADQGRYLLERSLDISSKEMQQAYRRQAALAACSQILLQSSDEHVIPAALEALFTATGGVCAAVDVNLPDSRGPARLRQWQTCLVQSAHPEASVELWDADPESHATLAAGRTFVVTAEGCSPEWAQQTVAHVPIVVKGTWLATLIVGAPASVAWDKAELQVLQVGAEMLGTFLEQQAARSELERLSRSKDRLIASVSHELRTPLTVVVGLAEELNHQRHRFSPDETAELIEMLHRQSRDVSNIVEDLLVAARASIGVLSIRPVEVKVHEEINRLAVEDAGSQLASIEVRAEPAVALADPTRLRQILRNLVTNAQRYGGAHVVIESTQTDHAAVISVSDDGPGVPEDLRASIFEPFTSAHPETTRPSAVGIGLAVSRELAQLMGGQLTYRHEDGYSVFELSLPRPMQR